MISFRNCSVENYTKLTISVLPLHHIMKKTTTPLLIGIILVSAITVAVTAISGSQQFGFGRWGTFQGIEEARTALRQLPMEINGWIADEERELDQTSITMLKIQDSYILRSYRNEATGAVVHLTLMVGPTGRITVHTPVVCFGGRDFVREGSPVRVPIDVELASGEQIIDTFWQVAFQNQSTGVNNRVSFYYGVSTGDVWYADENPRVTFQRYRFVYRIQAEAFSAMSDERDTVRQFLEDALPTIHEYMRPCR